MTKQIKFSDEEMKKFNDLQQKYVEIQYGFGQLSVHRIRLDEQLNDLNNHEEKLEKEFMDTRDAEKDFLNEITDRYGEGSFDPKTGIYTKID